MNTALITTKPHLQIRMSELLGECKILSLPSEATEEEVVLCDPESAVRLLHCSPTARVIVFSDLPSYAEGTALLALGIRGYANTYIHPENLMQMLETVKSGNIWLYPEFIHQMVQKLTDSEQRHSGVLEKLTERESETALLVADGLSNKEIASNLNITERTVKNHLTHIFEKLGVSDRLSLAMLLN